MNDLHHPCESWAEQISLAAAGCLSPDEEREIRRHIETCSDCRERLRQLTELCGVLAEVRLPAVGTEAAIVERVMSVVASGERIHSALLTRSLTTWRWIVRSPVSRIAAAVVFVLVIAGVALWFHAGAAMPAFADFIKPLLEAKTARYKMTTEITGASAGTTTTVVMMLGPSRSRSEMEIETPNNPKSKLVQIWDGYRGKSLQLEPEHKRATLYDYVDRPMDKTPKDADPLGCWRLFLLDARKAPGMKREPLGEKEIDGRYVIGFRITTPTAVIDAWGDPKTGMPVRMDVTTPLMPSMKMTMSDFELNVDLDESLFSIEPPAGYTVTSVRSPKTDDSPAGEKDLIETFRYYGELSGGTFPDLLDRETFSEMVYGGLWLFYSLDQSPASSEKHTEEHHAALRKFDRGLEFAVLMPKESDSHYAGKDVSLGTADTPIFWYRPKDAKKYRVIYADLSVGEAETPPIMPVAQPAQPERDLIEMLRMYSEWSGGALPATLDRTELIMVFMRKNLLAAVPEKQNKRSSEQWKKIAGNHLKFLRSVKFINLLPKEADWHYAGKRVALGAADTPIFWYRPKDAKKYRVIYADLSVRDADTPPNMPVVRPEQDLVEMFRRYSELTDGPFPDSLDSKSLFLKVSMKLLMKFPPEESLKPSAKHLQGMVAFQMKSQPGLDFASSLPPDADAHYAGRGISLGAADRPIFWYRPKDSKTYRVIYADLSIREADMPPNVPVAPPEQDLIDTLHYYCELNGGTFPDSLDKDNRELSPILEKKFGIEKGQKPDAKQTQEIVQITMKLLPGKTFIEQLPPDADAHYAGKGISLGAADTPIFWYRPKDAKKYRVIYADLSVHESDEPPNVPNAQPVPAPSSPKK